MTFEPTTETQKLAMDAVLGRPAKGIPTWLVHIMEQSMMERVAGVQPGAYRERPEEVYLACQKAMGVCMIDQFIPENPLSIGDRGYDSAEKGPATGAEQIVVDGMIIDSPESVVEHLERFVFPGLEQAIAAFDEDVRVHEILESEAAVQRRMGAEILKTGYGFVRFPHFRYARYGYVNYFMAYGLYREVIERDFSMQADLALRNNRAAARAYLEGDLPPLYRLDHDMGGSKGLLVDVKSLDRLWFPHFARCLEPMVKTHVRMIWHCDGNLMDLLPRLLEVGIEGFQGFQYEHGMDYEKICRMKTRDNEPLTIIAGVSVTSTLPMGTPQDVRNEIAWLVKSGPKQGLFLGCSSSMTPGVPWGNIQALIEGLRHFRTAGRG